MPLFAEKTLTDVVTPQNIKDLTGIRPNDYQFENVQDPDAELDNLLSDWIKMIGAHVHSRLKREVSETDEDYHAIRDIVIRHVAKLVAVSQQQRTTPIVQTDSFAVNILDTSEVTKSLAKELSPYKTRRVSIFSSAEEYQEDETT